MSKHAISFALCAREMSHPQEEKECGKLCVTSVNKILQTLNKIADCVV